MTVIDLMRFALRYWKMLVICLLIGLLAGYGYAYRQPKLYSATATAYVVAGTGASSSEAALDSGVAAGKAATYVRLMSSEVVAQRVIDKLNLNLSTQDISGSITAATDSASPTIDVSVSSTDPVLAKQIADTVVIEAAEQASLIESNGKNTSIVRMVPISNAIVPSTPYSPNYRKLLAFFGAAGLIAGVVLALTRRQLDNRIRTPQDVTDVTGVGIIGAIPKTTKLRSRRQTESTLSGEVGEAFRHLRTNLVYANPDSPARTVLVTSPQESEGKSTSAALLARALAVRGEAVLIIDADLRRPTVADTFGVDPAVGVTQVLGGSVSLADAIVETDTPSLFVLPAGRIPYNPAEVLGSKRFHALLAEIGDQYRVIIDAPPLLPVADSMIMATRVDGVLLVTFNGKGTKDALGRAIELLEGVHARILGIVLNAVPQGRTAGVYGYGRYGYGRYGSYNSADAQSRDAVKKRGLFRKKKG